MENKLIKIFIKVFKISGKKDILTSKKIQISTLKNYDSLKFLEFLSKIEKDGRY